MAISLAEIGRDRVDDDQGDVSNLNNLAFQQVDIGLQIESALSLAIGIADSGDDMHAVKVGVGRHQPRHDGICRAILSAQYDDVANRRTALTAWPIAAG